MLLFGPAIGAIRIGTDFLAAEIQYPTLESLPRWEAFKTVMWCAEAVIALLSAFAGWGLVRVRRWSAVRQAIAVLWLTGPLGAFAMGYAVPLLTLRESSAAQPLFIMSMLASFVGASVWTAYLLKSKRVRNTYCASGVRSSVEIVRTPPT
jgi:uncharacterized membrane protein